MKLNLFSLFLAILIAACGFDPVGTRTNVDHEPAVTKKKDHADPEKDLLDYESRFGFSFHYHSELTLKESSDKKTLKLTTPELSSTLEIKVLDKESDLEGYLKKQFPDISFKEISGKKGFFFEKELHNRLQGRYFFIGKKSRVISIELDASAFGNGTKWLVPVVSDLTLTANNE